MANAQRQLENWFRQFEHALDERVPNIVAETAVEFFKQRFTTQEWDKTPWPALNPVYAAKKTRGKGRILVRSDLLLNSIRPALVVPERVVISAGNSKVPYARIHNEGGRITGIRKVRGYVNDNFMGKGKAIKIKPHTRQVDYYMKQRQFMGHSVYLNREITSRLKLFFNTK